MLTFTVFSYLHDFVLSDQMEFDAALKAEAAQMNSKFKSDNKMVEKGADM